MRVGVLGGTFDPIHIGHLAAADDVASSLSLDIVLFVPNRQPPHKDDKTVSPARDRLAMVELAVASNPCFAVSRIELARSGPSYTIDTLHQLTHELPAGTDLYFLAGCDAIPQLHTWHLPDQLLHEFNFVVMERPMGEPIPWHDAERRFPGIRRRVRTVFVPPLDISSNDIRRRVREALPIRYYVLPPVERYIRDHNLYRSAT